MRILSLIRLALLIFILCWVGYNQNSEREGFGIETGLQTSKGYLKKLSHNAKKLSLVLEQSMDKDTAGKYKDY